MYKGQTLSQEKKKKKEDVGKEEGLVIHAYPRALYTTPTPRGRLIFRIPLFFDNKKLASLQHESVTQVWACILQLMLRFIVHFS